MREPIQQTMEQWLGDRVHIDRLKLQAGQQALFLKCPDCKQLRVMLNPYPVPECRDFMALELPCEQCSLLIQAPPPVNYDLWRVLGFCRTRYLYSYAEPV